MARPRRLDEVIRRTTARTPSMRSGMHGAVALEGPHNRSPSCPPRTVLFPYLSSSQTHRPWMPASPTRTCPATSRSCRRSVRPLRHPGAGRAMPLHRHLPVFRKQWRRVVSGPGKATHLPVQSGSFKCNRCSSLRSVTAPFDPRDIASPRCSQLNTGARSVATPEGRAEKPAARPAPPITCSYVD